jgi:hypothetical protein
MSLFILMGVNGLEKHKRFECTPFNGSLPLFSSKEACYKFWRSPIFPLPSSTLLGGEGHMMDCYPASYLLAYPELPPE